MNIKVKTKRFAQKIEDMPKTTFCTYEQSVRLKRLGFNWPCWHWFATSGSEKFPFRLNAPVDSNHGTEVSCPTTDLAIGWLREEMQLHVSVSPQEDIFGNRGWGFMVTYLPDLSVVGGSFNLSATYDEAMKSAIDYAIECAVIQYRKKNQRV